MYPRDFFDTYWRSELVDEVFVAMPFHSEFDGVWNEIIRPAVAQGSIGRLQARRVDATVLSGNVITDILNGIAHARIVLADISVCLQGRWVGQRNGNVMYEVGLSHALRHATEVLLIRSDDEQINFDVAQINVHRYDKTNSAGAKDQIARLVADLLKQIQQEKSLKVARAVDLLDDVSRKYIVDFALDGPFRGPNPQKMGEVLIAISYRIALTKLQELGILKNILIPSEGPAYILTEFGRAVAKSLGLVVRFN
jgi:hypothetical protein